MVEQGVTHFVEVGPRDVLSKLVQRIEQGVRVTSVGDVAMVEAF
jgi:malonyl CoA-acyl carrier protein transacylase